MPKVAPLAIAAAWLLLAVNGHASDVQPAALQLFQVIDALDVAHRWPAGLHVNWETGEPDGKPVDTIRKHTHCSAFAGSVAKRLGIDLLRPPEHSATLLANAQYDWLMQQGADHGWHAVPDAVAAQAAANRGDLVVAIYRSHDDKKSGHIAIVRPSDKPDTAIAAEGPQITQAGNHNYVSTSLREGFAGHPAAWGRSEVRYFRHAVTVVAGS
jgi:hypothetical protein